MLVRRSMTLAAVSALALATVVQGHAAAGAKGGWHVVRSPGGSVAVLAASSFTSADDGWAVGSTGESLVGDGIDTLIEHWDGAKWRPVSSAAVPQSNEALTGVSSTAPDNAWAVGWQDPYGTTRVHAFLMHWDGTSWSVVQGPQGAGIVSAVDARAADDVWAVGVGLFEHFDGTQWTVVKAPRPDVQPAAVTALAADDAWAVGSRPDRRPGYRSSKPYIAHWDGSSWSSVSIPRQQTPGRLAAVSAVSPSDIWAVGATGSRPSSPYALHYDGSSWTTVTVPGASKGSGLSGVTAIATGDVWAVGNKVGNLRDGFAVLRCFTEHWDGSQWSIVKSPNDSRHDNFLVAAAASGGRVWAFGGDGGTLVESR